MRYIDPYECLNLTVQDPSEVDANMLKKARQRIMAEFELSADGFLKVDGKNLDKTTVLALLDQMEHPETRQHYWKLRTITGLIPFLKEGRLSWLGKVNDKSVLDDPAFAKFCSRLLAPVFEECLTRALQKKLWGDVRLIHHHADLIATDDRSIAYKGAVRFVQDKIMQLETSVQADPQTLKTTAWLSFYESGLIRTLNLFPSQYQQVRNRYAELLGQLAIHMGTKAAEIKEGLLMIEAACSLSVDSGIASDNNIYHNRLKVLMAIQTAKERGEVPPMDGSTQQNRRADSGKGRSPACGVVSALFAVIFALIRIANGCESNSNHRDRNYQFSELLERQSNGFGKGNSYYDRLEGSQGDASRVLDALRESNPKAGAITETLSKRPKTGDQPYAEFAYSNFDTSGGTIGSIKFKNKSSKDLLLFVTLGSKLTECRYVRAGETFNRVKLPIGSYNFEVYNGKKWCDSIAEIDGKRLGGFLDAVDFVGSYDRRPFGSRTEVPQFRYQVDDETKGMHNLTFNGENFQLKD